MLVHHQAAVLDSRIERLPILVVKRFQPGAVFRNQRQQNAPAQTRLGNPLHILDRLLNVIGQYQPHSGAAVRVLVAKILEPAIVSTNARQGSLIVLRAWRLAGNNTFGKERRYCVRVNHLSYYSLTVLVPASNFEVPVAQLLARVVLLRRVAVTTAPLIESLPPEFLALELREALHAIGEITGETTPDEVLEQIFSKFCVGK